MQLYPNDNKNKAVLIKDIFEMIGLKGLSEGEKDKYLDNFMQVVLRYLLQEKIKDVLPAEELPEIARMYEAASKDKADEFAQQLSDRIPNFEELFTESLTEVKIRVVKDHYTSLLEESTKELESLADGESDKRTLLDKKISLAQQNLEYVAESRFDLIKYEL